MPKLDKRAWKLIDSHESTKLSAPASQHDIDAFEYRNGLQLPESHRAFLLKHNGGVLGRVRMFGVNRIDALDLDRTIREMRAELESTRPDVLPLASTWGGDCFCFDLSRGRRTANYPVMVWRHDYTFLQAYGTGLTPKGVAKLKKALGGLDIEI